MSVNFQSITEELNAALRRAHEAGLSVFIATNGWITFLRQGELAQMEIRLNDCAHDVSWLPFPDGGEYCQTCGVTRDAEKNRPIQLKKVEQSARHNDLTYKGCTCSQCVIYKAQNEWQ